MPNSDTLPIHILAPDLGFTVSGEAFIYSKHGRAKVSGKSLLSESDEKNILQNLGMYLDLPAHFVAVAFWKGL